MEVGKKPQRMEWREGKKHRERLKKGKEREGGREPQRMRLKSCCISLRA
jgi:hypothetical protein